MVSLAATVVAHPVLRKFAHFALIGVCGTATHYLVLSVLVEWFHVGVLTATTLGMATGAVVNYALNRRFVFVSDTSHASALPKFMLIAALGAGINWLVMAALLQTFDIFYLLAQLIATGTVLLWNFAANYLWTFRR